MKSIHDLKTSEEEREREKGRESVNRRGMEGERQRTHDRN